MHYETRKEKVEKKYTVYIADDGKEFDSESKCREYENSIGRKNMKELEPFMVKELKEMIPIHFSAEYSEMCYYTWFKANNKEEFDKINKILDNVFDEPNEYPYYMCVETESEFEGFISDYYTQLPEYKNITRNFWGKLGYELEFKKKGEKKCQP